MRRMKDTGREWIGNIPAGWSVCRIKNVADIYTGNSIKDEEKELFENSTDAIPYIATKDIDADLQTIDYENGMWVAISDNSFKKALKGSILLCIEGGSAGKKIAFINQDVCFVNKLCCFCSKDSNNKFLYYFLMSSAFTALFNSYISGLIGGVSVGELRNFPFVLPPFEEQKRISIFLDKKIIEINFALERIRRVIEEYKKLKQSIIVNAVTKGVRDKRPMKDSGIEWIGEIPLEWEIIRIKWILNERKEKSDNGDEEPLSMSQKYGIIPTKEMVIIPNMAASFVGAKIVHSGDLVFNKLKAHLGVFAVSQYDGLVSPDYAVYYSKGIADVKYLEYLFKTQQYIAEFKKHSSGVGAGLTRLYTDELFSIYCLLPHQNEQEEIICYLNKKLKEIDTLISKKEQYFSEIENYKKSLIYEYVTGKKEVPET